MLVSKLDNLVEIKATIPDSRRRENDGVPVVFFGQFAEFFQRGDDERKRSIKLPTWNALPWTESFSELRQNTVDVIRDVSNISELSRESNKSSRNAQWNRGSIHNTNFVASFSDLTAQMK